MLSFQPALLHVMLRSEEILEVPCVYRASWLPSVCLFPASLHALMSLAIAPTVHPMQQTYPIILGKCFWWEVREHSMTSRLTSSRPQGLLMRLVQAICIRPCHLA